MAKAPKSGSDLQKNVKSPALIVKLKKVTKAGSELVKSVK
jgi:hypothetical protein